MLKGVYNFYVVNTFFIFLKSLTFKRMTLLQQVLFFSAIFS